MKTRCAFPVLDDTGRGLQLADPGLSKLEYAAVHMMIVLIPLMPERPYSTIAEHAVLAAKAVLEEAGK